MSTETEPGTMHGVRLDDTHTTMTLPHKRLELGGKVYFVATFPEGDLSVHEWKAGFQGYGNSEVTFLLEDGSFETVRGPHGCNDLFDFGRAKLLKKRFGLEAKPTACRIRAGLNLSGYACFRDGPREVHAEEDGLSCDPLKPRVERLVSEGASLSDQWEFEYRGGSHFPQREAIEEILA
jgi:hypothetical protein